MKKIEFSKLEEEIKIRRCTIPQHVPVTKNPDEETSKQVIERQERYPRTAREISASCNNCKLKILPISRILFPVSEGNGN